MMDGMSVVHRIAARSRVLQCMMMAAGGSCSLKVGRNETENAR